jgi:ABC-type multidrug transport system ATPase subunit
MAKGERRATCEALLRQTNLWDVRKQKLGGYSGGMRQRFGVAVALLGNPKLMIVDEPTAGLDPAERVRFLNLLSELGENSVVILSTHIVEDVSELCTRMAIIDRGEILVEAEPLSAVDKLKGRIWRRVISKDELSAVEREHTVISTKLLSGRTVVHVNSDASPGPGFEPAEPDLEDVYFSTMAVLHGRPGERPERAA